MSDGIEQYAPLFGSRLVLGGCGSQSYGSFGCYIQFFHGDVEMKLLVLRPFGPGRRGRNGKRASG